MKHNELIKNDANAFMALATAVIFAVIAYHLVPDGSLNLFHVLASVVGFFFGFFVGAYVLTITGMLMGWGIILGGAYFIFFVCLPWLFQSS